MKTAVEWLIEQWPILESQLPQQLIEQAKEMEKEQVCLAYADGFNLRQQTTDVSDNYTTAEQYYNETFKSE
jgi:hypothetical protein